MGQYPWGFTGVTPNASDNLPDTGSYDGQRPRLHRRRRAARRAGAPLRGAGRHLAEAGLGRDRPRSSGDRSPVTGAPARSRARRPTPSRRQCDDGPFGKGTGGELTYTLSLPAGGSQDRVAGASPAPTRARRTWPSAGADQAAAEPRPRRWPPRSPPASSSRSMTQLSLPGDPLVQNAVDWGKQNIADLTLSAQNLQIRWTNQGKQFPRAARHRAARRPGSAPATPTTRGSSAPTRSTPRSPRSSVGQFAAIEDHLRTLREISDILNNRSGVVAHEVGVRRLDLVRPRLPADQSRRHHRLRLQHRRDGQVPQHRRADLAVDRATTPSVTRCTTSRCATCATS